MKYSIDHSVEKQEYLLIEWGQHSNGSRYIKDIYAAKDLSVLIADLDVSDVAWQLDAATVISQLPLAWQVVSEQRRRALWDEAIIQHEEEIQRLEAEIGRLTKELAAKKAEGFK
jgi:hypothetical protein